MYVGVILYKRAVDFEILCIPHVCGGDPYSRRCTNIALTYSPCMWG